MLIETVPLLADNYGYLVVCEESGQAAIVDPAEADAVVAAVEARGVELIAIWNTHHHRDHTGGNEALLRRWKLRVYGHRSESGRIAGLTDPLEDGDAIALGRLAARVLHTPGHTRGALVYRVGDAAFSGDTLFGAGCGRLFEGDPQTMYRSLNQRIGRVPAETRIYFGHEYTAKNLAFACAIDPGNQAIRERRAAAARLRERGCATVPSTLAEELQTNPFLRCEEAEIRASLADRFPSDDLSDPVRAFARLRELRDTF
ncbi:MAG: hydroxyacylglutathione hydrolase [Proteobacteria bacterium]|nr:hydroxyacylglutathione hydrolase [Pseudomonadota bacterium]